MSANTTIEWATKSWNPVRGCSRVSPGCDRCYAMLFAHRFAGAGKPYEGLTTLRKGKVDWSGVARFIPGELGAPLSWKKPERVFVNSMSDLFHHSVTDGQILDVFRVMAQARHHQFLILTKRPERMLEWFQRWLDNDPPGDPVLARGPAEVRAKHTSGRALMFAEMIEGWGMPPDGAAYPTFDWIGGMRWWPDFLRNVWLGVSVENQRAAEERIPILLQCPASVRWISAEPLLGPLDLRPYLHRGKHQVCPKCLFATNARAETCPNDGTALGLDIALDWVVVGGESGPGARPFCVKWARAIVSACAEASVPVFVKQLGSRPFRAAGEDETDWGPTVRGREGDDLDQPAEVRLDNRKGGNPEEWPVDIRVREFPR